VNHTGAHVLTFETPRAGAIQAKLQGRGIIWDMRGDRIRFGFGVHQTEAEIARSITAVAAALEA
jgi:kynureninase